jgi:integrase
MTPLVADALLEWQPMCPKSALDLVFPSEAGTVQRHSNIADRGFAALQCRGFGEVRYSLEGLRHCFAAWCIGQRLSLGELKYVLGHASLDHTYSCIKKIAGTEEEAPANPVAKFRDVLGEFDATLSKIAARRDLGTV